MQMTCYCPCNFACLMITLGPFQNNSNVLVWFACVCYPTEYSNVTLLVRPFWAGGWGGGRANEPVFDHKAG